MVGKLEDGTITTAYNAGNVSGVASVGGLVGEMTGGSLAKAYNADNNTVLYTGDAKANPTAYYGFKSGTVSYLYSFDTQKWYHDSIMVGNEVAFDKMPAESTRIYNNRLAYRDATVSGNTNVGGLIGKMTNGMINQAYNAGQVTGRTAAVTGALVGTLSGGTVGAASNTVYYATTDNAGTAISNGGNASTAFGNANDTTQTVKAITLDELEQAGNLGWSGLSTTTNPHRRSRHS